LLPYEIKKSELSGEFGKNGEEEMCVRFWCGSTGNQSTFQTYA